MCFSSWPICALTFKNTYVFISLLVDLVLINGTHKRILHKTTLANNALENCVFLVGDLKISERF